MTTFLTLRLRRITKGINVCEPHMLRIFVQLHATRESDSRMEFHCEKCGALGFLTDGMLNAAVIAYQIADTLGREIHAPYHEGCGGELEPTAICDPYTGKWISGSALDALLDKLL